MLLMLRSRVHPKRHSELPQLPLYLDKEMGSEKQKILASGYPPTGCHLGII